MSASNPCCLFGRFCPGWWEREHSIGITVLRPLHNLEKMRYKQRLFSGSPFGTLRSQGWRSRSAQDALQRVSKGVTGKKRGRLCRNFVFFIAIVTLFASAKTRAEVEWSLLLNPQWNRYQQNSVFALPDSFVPQPLNQSRQILEWKTEYHGLNLLGNWNYTLDNQTSSSKGSMLEAYFSGTMGKVDFSIGKKITSWGNGYGFRPVDVIFNEDLQSTSEETFAGVPQLSLNYYLDMGELALVAVPQGAQGDMLFGRYFESFEQYDLQLLAGYSQDRGVQLGFAGVWIVNDSLSLHVDTLLMEKYQKSLNRLTQGSASLPLASENPFVTQEYRQGQRWLLGMNYSWGEGDNLIVEYWFDPLAYSRQQWQDLFHLAKNQRQSLSLAVVPQEAVYGNLAWDLQATRSSYLLQNNWFIYWSRQGEYWQPSVSLLYAPDDQGVIATLESSRSFNWLKVNIGYRLFDGERDSVYKQLLLRDQFYFNLSRSF